MLNKVILMGRLARDPELRYTQSGIASCNVTIAIDRRFQKQGEQKQADFIPCVAWRQTAEFVSKYFKKGSMIAVTGSIQTRSYDKDGQKRYVTEVVIDEVSFTGEKREGGNDQGGQGFRPVHEQGFSTPEDAFEAFTPVDSDEDLPF